MSRLLQEFYQRGRWTVDRLREIKSIEEDLDNLLSIPDRHNSCCRQVATPRSRTASATGTSATINEIMHTINQRTGRRISLSDTPTMVSFVQCTTLCTMYKGSVCTTDLEQRGGAL